MNTPPINEYVIGNSVKYGRLSFLFITIIIQDLMVNYQGTTIIKENISDN
jgi:hypothetical protein